MFRRAILPFVACVLAALPVACGGPPPGPGPMPDQHPAVFSVTPNTGPIAGGTEMTIRGARFAAGASVTVGGRAATDVTVQGSDVLVAKSPEGAAAGAADVAVTVGGRTGSLPAGFTYLMPPANNPPVITSITAQGTRPNEPADFADLGETIRVTAAVRDDETAVDQLELQWTATAGTFSGSGPSVTWQAPPSATTPAQVTLTLRVIERYGAGGIFVQEVTATRTVRLHDSARELGAMSERFLTEFSRTADNRDWRDIMRDFNFDVGVCPHPTEVEAEREQVIDHYTNFTMHSFRVDRASAQIAFRGTCFGALQGDACISVQVRWDSTDRRTNVRRSTSGTDHLSGVYAASRWWLCSSRYEETGTSVGHEFYTRRPNVPRRRILGW